MSSPAMTGPELVAQKLGTSVPRPRWLRAVPDDETTRPSGRAENSVWRPTELGQYVGQERNVQRLTIWVTSALKRKRQPGPVMITGPRGLGKTSLAEIVAAMVNATLPESEHVGFHESTGDACSSPLQLANVLNKLEPGDVLFIDEAHQMGSRAQEMIGLGIESGRIIVPGNKSGTTDAVPHDLPRFTLVIATTKPADISAPLRDRFGLTLAMDWYHPDELATIVARKAERECIEMTDDAALMVANTGRQTPRVALGVFGQVFAYADTVDALTLDVDTITRAFETMGIDPLGLTDRERDYLGVVASWNGRRVGLKNLASASGLDPKEINNDIEPPLVRAGLLDAGNRGRCLTRHAYEHLYPTRPIPPMLGHV